MAPKINKPGLLTVLLIILQIFLGLGGIGGGIAILLDPSGTAMGLPPDLVDGLFIDSFVLPSLFLIALMGLLPLLTAHGLWKAVSWIFAQQINPFQKQTWAWTLSLFLGLLLIGWILFQILLWGSPIGIQILYLVTGGLITLLSIINSKEFQL